MAYFDESGICISCKLPKEDHTRDLAWEEWDCPVPPRVACTNSPPPPEPAQCGTCLEPMRDGKCPLQTEHDAFDRDELNNLRAHLAAAQALIVVRDGQIDRVEADWLAATERAEEFKRIGQQFERDSRKHFDQSCTNLERAEKAEAWKAEATAVLADNHEAAKTLGKLGESFSQTLLRVGAERDAAIKDKEEAIERADQQLERADAEQAAREKAERELNDRNFIAAVAASGMENLKIAKLTAERDAERKRADEEKVAREEAFASNNEAIKAKEEATVQCEQWRADFNQVWKSKEALQATAKELLVALESVHPQHPQPEICSACALLDRTLPKKEK